MPPGSLEFIKSIAALFSMAAVLIACGSDTSSETEQAAVVSRIPVAEAATVPVETTNEDLLFSQLYGEASGSDYSAFNPDCPGLPECRGYGSQHPDCNYRPKLEKPYYAACSGPIVWVDTTHNNAQKITPRSVDQPGRFWGFASLLFADGFDVRDSSIPLGALSATEEPDILVIANAALSYPATEVFKAGEVDAVISWVENGGSLLLVIDHSPFDLIDELMSRLGLELRDGGIDTLGDNLFYRSRGTLAADGFPTTGAVDSEKIMIVKSLRGSGFTIAAKPPVNIIHKPIMTFGPHANTKIFGRKIYLTGQLQGVQILVGEGRVVVLAEAAMLSAQISAAGQAVGMHQTPDNEQFLLNIMHWLAGG